jgi:hypothetical protein
MVLLREVKGQDGGVEYIKDVRLYKVLLRVQSQQRSQFRTKIPGISSTQSSNNNMSTRTERFQRKPKEKEEETPEEPEEVIRFPPEKEAVRHCP